MSLGEGGWGGGQTCILCLCTYIARSDTSICHKLFGSGPVEGGNRLPGPEPKWLELYSHGGYSPGPGGGGAIASPLPAMARGAL